MQFLRYWRHWRLPLGHRHYLGSFGSFDPFAGIWAHLRLYGALEKLSLLQHLSLGIRRRPTLPGRFQPSTISAKRLNFCVRYGNRWIPLAIITGNLWRFLAAFSLCASLRLRSLPRSTPSQLHSVGTQYEFLLFASSALASSLRSASSLALAHSSTSLTRLRAALLSD